jgi:plasmid stabilization system protein ParE
MAIMRRDEEKDVLSSWLGTAAMAIGVGVQPFRLKEDLPERHDELRAIFKRLGDAPLRYRHPEIFQQEGGTAPMSGAKYHEYRRSGSDRTWMVDIGTVLTDADEHKMRIGAIRAFLFAARDTTVGRDQPSINEVRLHQRPGTEDMLRVSWKGGKLSPDGIPAAFTDDFWDELSLLDWTEEQKRSYLLDIWEQVAGLPARAAAPARKKTA